MPTLNNSTVIGIDLGTTCCCVAYINKNGIVDVIANSDGYRTTPSYVAFNEKGKLVGKIAKEDIFKNKKNVIYDSKRLIGRKFDDNCVQDDMKNWAFKVKESNNQPLIEISVDGKAVCYKPEEISAMLLEHLKKATEEYIGTSITDAVITVPAHFNYHQRTATAEAGKLAGLNVLRIINEPTAATLAYIHKNEITDPKNILVFDLGGGTLDVSIVQVKSNNIKVVATAGNTHLGGRDFDNNLKNFICKKIETKYGEDLLKSKITARKIWAATENVKIRLSSVEVAILDLQRLHNGEDAELEISREEFEQINSNLFESAIDIVENCLADAKLAKNKIDDVVLVGGSTRIPKIQKMLSDLFGGKVLSKTINPDEAVAYGAAVQTAKFIECDKSKLLPLITDVTPLSLGVGVLGNLMSVMIPRNSTIPATVTKRFCTVIDKLTARSWNIYEGERRFVGDNIRLGKCTLKIPPKPPGYPADLTFHVTEDGILQISVSDPTDLHTTLSIVYERQDSQIVSDIINDATVYKSVDDGKENITIKWNNLICYCVKLKAICDYDKKNMTPEDKATIKSIATDIYNWTRNHRILNGSEEEAMAVKEKHQEIRSVCEPLAKKYGYDVYYLGWDKFYKLITQENYTYIKSTYSKLVSYLYYKY